MSDTAITGVLRRLIAAAALALVLAGPALAQGEPVKIPGGVTVVPPEGFEPSGEFMGFEDPKTGTNFFFTITDAAAFAELQPTFASVEAANELFGSQGLKLSAAHSVEGPGGTIPYLRGEQEVDGTVVGKWLALLGGEQTVLVTANVAPGAEMPQAQFEAILTSITIDAPVDIAELAAALPFLVDPVEPFVLAEVMDGSMAALVDVSVPQGEPQPAIIVDAQLNVTGMPPVAEAAEQLLRAITDFAEIEIDRSEAAAFAAGEAWLLSGIAEDPNMGTVRVMQWLGRREGDFVRLVAYAPIGRFDELQAAIEAVAAGVQWR